MESITNPMNRDSTVKIIFSFVISLELIFCKFNDFGFNF